MFLGGAREWIAGTFGLKRKSKGARLKGTSMRELAVSFDSDHD